MRLIWTLDVKGPSGIPRVGFLLYTEKADMTCSFNEFPAALTLERTAAAVISLPLVITKILLEDNP